MELGEFYNLITELAIYNTANEKNDTDDQHSRAMNDPAIRVKE